MTASVVNSRPEIEAAFLQCAARHLSWVDDAGFTLLSRCGIIRSMKFATVLDRDEDGMWIVECPSIPGCISQGASREEALANIREAIVDCLEVRAERGMALTVEMQQVEVAV